MLDGIIEAQASLLAFGDAYRVVLVLIAVMLPFVWLMRRPAVPMPGATGDAGGSGSEPTA